MLQTNDTEYEILTQKLFQPINMIYEMGDRLLYVWFFCCFFPMHYNFTKFNTNETCEQNKISTRQNKNDLKSINQY